VTDAVRPYSVETLTAEDVGELEGAVVLDFGTNWCGHCRAAAPKILAALQQHPGVQHIKVEDGKGRSLGRAYGVKQWPTLVFLRDGTEADRLVRPPDVGSLEAAIASII
jgi:thioredoxin 1